LVILLLLLVNMGGQHDGVFLSGSPPIVYIHMCVFHLANKLCCCCSRLSPSTGLCWTRHPPTVADNHDTPAVTGGRPAPIAGYLNRRTEEEATVWPSPRRKKKHTEPARQGHREFPFWNLKIPRSVQKFPKFSLPK